MKTVASTLLCDTCMKSSVCKFRDDFVRFNKNVLSQNCPDVFKIKAECIHYDCISTHDLYDWTGIRPLIDPTKVTCE